MSGFILGKSTKLWIGNIGSDVKNSYIEEEVYKRSQGVENFQRVVAGSGKPDYFIVTFPSFSSAAACKNGFRDFRIEGNKIIVSWYIDKGIIWIKNLSKDMTREGLISSFEQFGEIVGGDVIKCPFTGKCKGYGWLHFKKRTAACYVVMACEENLFMIGGNPIPLEVSLAQEYREPFEKIIQEPQPHFAQPGTLEWEFATEIRKAQMRIKAEMYAIKGIHKNEMKTICQRHIKDLASYKEKIAKLKQIVEPHK